MQAVQCQDEFCNFATFAKNQFLKNSFYLSTFSTTPQHIKAIAEAVKDIKPRQRKADLNPNEMLLSGLGMVLNKMSIEIRNKVWSQVFLPKFNQNLVLI